MGILEEAINAIPPLNENALAAARERLRNQARPAGSLGILEDVSARLAAIAGTIDVRLTEKVVVTCAGDH
ncbi:MAG: nicotinate-nucleotide--dimethylbenzimidazole phosphoribosyltransferase, partial [Desulfococcaceae bacterium]